MDVDFCRPRTTITIPTAKIVIDGMVSKDISLAGKTVLITGANTGIGYETAKDLAGRGAKVLMACRDSEKCTNAIDEIRKEVPNADLRPLDLDLASLESVRACAKVVNETEERLDILINNAGIMACPKWKTKDGFEMQFGVNHIGHFLLTNLLLELIKKSAPSRIVIVSSSGHYRGQMKWDDLMSEKDYVPFKVYSQSKLANVLFARKLSTMLKDTGVTCNSLHPGLVRTDLGRHFFNKDGVWNTVKYYITLPFVKAIFTTPLKGAQTSIYCAVAPELEKETGNYYTNCQKKEEAPAARSDEDAGKLWEKTEEFIRALNKTAL